MPTERNKSTKECNNVGRFGKKNPSASCDNNAAEDNDCNDKMCMSPLPQRRLNEIKKPFTWKSS